MMNISDRVFDLENRLNSLIITTTINEVDSSTGLVTVDLYDGQSAYIPLLQLSNSQVNSYIPPQKGEMVLLYNSDSSFAIRGFYSTMPEGIGDKGDITVANYSGGMKLKYNNSTNSLDISGVKNLNLNGENVNISGDKALNLSTGNNSIKISSDDITFDSSSVNLGSSAKALVTVSTTMQDSLGGPVSIVSGQTTVVKAS